MAHLWQQDNERQWQARRLGAEAAELGAGGAAYLMPASADVAKNWFLVGRAGAAVRVNGHTSPAGLRALTDRDEIRVAEERYFYSAESLATVEPFPGATRPVLCGRCKVPLEQGDLAVCCPNCGVWQHEEQGPDGRRCFTYAAQCSNCSQETALDAELKWNPEQE